MVAGEGLFVASRLTLRVVACGNAFSLRSNRTWSKLLILPCRAEYGANERDIMNKSQESDGGGGRIIRRFAPHPSGRCLLQRFLAALESNLVEASHPSLHGQNMVQTRWI